MRDWRQAIPEHYVWSKSKRYIRVLPYAGKAENSVKKEAKKQGAMGKNRDSALGKGLRKLHAFIQEVIMNYVFAVRAVLLDGCVCNTEKAEGLLQRAGGGKSYIYTAARYSGVIFEFYAERNPERVWSISPERDTSESVPPKPQKKRQI